jgi:hypothetical protein
MLFKKWSMSSKIKNCILTTLPIEDANRRGKLYFVNERDVDDIHEYLPSLKGVEAVSNPWGESTKKNVTKPNFSKRAEKTS